MRYFSDNDFIFVRGNHDLVNELLWIILTFTIPRDRQFILNTDIMPTG